MARACLLALAASILGACGAPYRWMSLPSDGEILGDPYRRRIGCLDVEVDRLADVFTIDLGNRCDAAIRVDLGRLRVLAPGVDGRPIPLRAYDPRGEIGTALLDGRDSARERIEYPGAHQTCTCLDLAGINLEAPPASVAPMCFCADTVLRPGADAP